MANPTYSDPRKKTDYHRGLHTTNQRRKLNARRPGEIVTPTSGTHMERTGMPSYHQRVAAIRYMNPRMSPRVAESMAQMQWGAARQAGQGAGRTMDYRPERDGYAQTQAMGQSADAPRPTISHYVPSDPANPSSDPIPVWDYSGQPVQPQQEQQPKPSQPFGGTPRRHAPASVTGGSVVETDATAGFPDPLYPGMAASYNRINSLPQGGTLADAGFQIARGGQKQEAIAQHDRRQNIMNQLREKNPPKRESKPVDVKSLKPSTQKEIAAYRDHLEKQEANAQKPESKPVQTDTPGKKLPEKPTPTYKRPDTKKRKKVGYHDPEFTDRVKGTAKKAGKWLKKNFGHFED